MAKVVGQCQLCLKQEELVQSHIIPKSMYKGIEFGREYMKIYSSNPNVHAKISKSGIYDRIVCHECESVFGIYDNYAKSILFDLSPNKITYDNGVKLYSHKNVCYSKIKLFFMSMIWRAAVSNNRFFERVKLGAHCEPLRMSIINKDPGDADDYSVVVCKYDNEDLSPFISPIRERFLGVNFYRFYISGYRIQVKIDSRKIPSDIGYLVLNEGEDFRMLRLTHEDEDRVVRSLWKKNQKNS